MGLRGSLSEKSREKNKDAGGIAACIIIRGSTSIIEFQRQLYVSWWLGSCDLAHRGTVTHVGRIVLDVVKRVDEVRAELQAEPLRNGKVLVQTQVHVGVTRRAQV